MYRCNTLVKKYKSVITNYFQPLDTYNSLALDLVSKARNHCQSNLLLGVHIRRGDYRYFQGGKYYFPISFYKSFIQKINSLSSHSIGFLIVSDERLSIDQFDGLNVYLSNSSEIVDLIALSMCDGVIGPPSTFSYFACSILGKSNLLHLENWHQPIPPSFIASLHT